MTDESNSIVTDDSSAKANSPLHLTCNSAKKPLRKDFVLTLSANSRGFVVAALALACLPKCLAMVMKSKPSTRLNTAQLIRQQRSESAPTLLSEARDNQRRYLRELGVDSKDLYSSLLDAAISSPQSDSTSTKRSWTEALFGVDEDENENEIDIAARVREEAHAVADLQTATGSEIPDMELHLQMEAARKRAGSVEGVAGSTTAAFIDRHVTDATNIEKVAMSTLPLQLPSPAVSVIETTNESISEETDKAMTATRESVNESQQTSIGPKVIKKRKAGSQNSTNAKVKKKGTPSEKNEVKSTKDNPSMTVKKLTSQRVSREEEIELARIIQRGSELHRIKSDFESEHGRSITRQEWTDLAGLDSPKELRRLVSTYRSAKNKLVTANMGLVHAVVRSQYGPWALQRGISHEELVQEGSMGLIRAAELFDPSRGLRFSTYATIWIKGVLSNSKIDEVISLPAREKTKWNKIRKASADILREHGEMENYKPKAREVASRIGMKAEEVDALTRKMTKAHNLMSLDYKYQNQGRSGTDSSETDLHNDKALHADADLVERLQLRADVIAALARNLDPREARLVRLRYGLKDGISRSLTECADAMGISREKARRLALECLKKLREADDANSLQEYLLTVA